jgi:NAD(P)-dependent dehydrogenase (short-subunit alcohol dehydrogenase family)
VARRTIIITGASDGIGAAAARQLRRAGENVVVVGRSEGKTKAVAAELDSDWFVADFADLSQVRALARDLLVRYPRIDVLANNAGGMTSRGEFTVDGHEKTLQVNYLAPFLLTTLVLDRLVESGAAVINTSSSSHKLAGRVSVDDLLSTGRRPSRAYALSKLAVNLFSVELHRRYGGFGLCSAAQHPGYVNSNFGRSSGSRFLMFMQHTPVALMTPSAERGCRQLVWLACSVAGVDWKSGEYYSGHKLASAHRQTYDPVLARELWDRSLDTVRGSR